MNQEELLAERYGKKPKNPKRDRLAIIGIAVVILVGFLTWAIAVTAENSGKPNGNLLSFSIESASLVSVEISASEHRNQNVICQVEALAEDYEVVGYKEVPLAKGQEMTKTTVNTVKPAVSAVVKDCWFK
jgi:Na+/proline symporter